MFWQRSRPQPGSLSQLHPLWLALVLLAGQALPLAWRRRAAVGTGFIIGAARISYDKIGFGFAPLPLGPAIAVYTVFDRRGPALRIVTAILVLVGVSDQQYSLADHADGLPAGFIPDFSILPSNVKGILEHAHRDSETDAVFLLVENVFSRIPSEVHGGV